MLNINEEDKQFIKELSTKMLHQNTRGTAQPYGLIIGKETKQITFSPVPEGLFISWKDEDYYTYEEFREALEEVYGEGSSVFRFLDEWCTDIDDIKREEKKINTLLDIPCKVYGYNTVDDFSSAFCGNFFLTEDAAKGYINQNKHNLGNSAFTYGIHLQRNKEMGQLIKIIHKLAKAFADGK